MSKKRALVLGLILLPLAVGGGIIASLAKGTRSSDLTGLEAPADAGDLANTAQEAPAGTSPRIEPATIPASSDEPPTPIKSTPAREAPSSSGETITIETDQSASEPLFASTAFTSSEAEEELPAMGTYARSALYTLAGRAHGGGAGGGGGSGTTLPSGSDTGASPDNTSKNPTGSSGESSTAPSSDSDEPSKQGPSKEEQTETENDGENTGDDDSTGESPPPVFFPPTEEPSKPVQVPEPASLALLGLGLLGCALARRRTVK